MTEEKKTQKTTNLLRLRIKRKNENTNNNNNKLQFQLNAKRVI